MLAAGHRAQESIDEIRQRRIVRVDQRGVGDRADVHARREREADEALAREEAAGGQGVAVGPRIAPVRTQRLERRDQQVTPDDRETANEQALEDPRPWRDDHARIQTYGARQGKPSAARFPDEQTTVPRSLGLAEVRAPGPTPPSRARRSADRGWPGPARRRC